MSTVLTDPLAIGSHTASNRIVFGPHETNLGYDRSFSNRHLAYYGRRAAAGAGIIVTEEASVHPSDWPYERAPLASECGPGWSEISAVVHRHGGLVLAALGHAGGQGTSHWSQRELWAPSRVPEVNTREVPKWMEASDIEAVVAGFAAGARIAVEAGCDGVEINAGQYSLVRQFLSGLTNQRDDEWGGDKERFARDVLVAVRAAVGSDAVVALRLSCDELAPWAGLTPEMAAGVASSLASDVDLLTVVRGSIFSVGATRPDGHTPAGFNLDLVRQIRSAVRDATGDRVPVVAQGSIVDVGQAEWAIGDGVADAIEMTRAQIADADLVAKLVAGTPERIRPCVLCNQMCQVRDNRNPIVSCIGDPFSGHETEDPPVVGRTTEPLDVRIVGGGPSGLEAARVAASRGHRVRLVERSARLGGAVRTAANGAGRERLASLVDWLESECRVLGVGIETEREADAEELAGLDPAELDNVVIATGALPGDRDYSVTAAAQVVTAATALDDPDGLPDGAVLVWDPIGGPIGVSVAELLAAAGRTIGIATPDYIVGNELARSGDLAPANARLAQAGVEMHKRSTLVAVKKGVAVLRDRFTGADREVRAAVVVDAGHRLPDESTWQQVLDRTGRKLPRSGDAVAPRTIHEAILEGRRVAIDLG